MKVLVTGSSGLLGAEVLNCLLTRGWIGAALNRTAFLKASKSERLLMLNGFDVIIHAAANTNVDLCELEPENCYFDNCFLTEQLHKAAKLLGLRFVFISSTGVYGRWKNGAYHEYDFVLPTTIHHSSKYVSEKLVLSCPEDLVIRTGWLFGKGGKKNFVANRLNEIRQANEVIYANTEQFGSPTYTLDCTLALLDLIADNCVGVYNVVNAGVASRFDYVKEIVSLSGASVRVLPMDAKGFSRHADVSENEAALSYRMKFEGRQQLRTWQGALEDYMRDSGLLGCLS